MPICAVDDPQHDFRFFKFLECAADADLFHLVVRLPDACCVDEAEERAANVHRVLNRVARGAVHVAHDGFLFSEQRVEQGGFTGVCVANDCHGDAVLDGVAEAEGRGEAG